MTLMDENEELLEILKPGMAMLKEWFDYRGDLPVIIEVQESAQRIDYLLGAALAGYEYVIKKHEVEPDMGLTEWHCRYKPANTEVISFYVGMHCMALSHLVTELYYASGRTGQKIRSTLLRELMFKQLELCRLMVNYSIEGDSWGRVFRGAVLLIELIDPEVNRSEIPTQIAQWECAQFDEDDEEFRYPRFDNLNRNSGAESMLTLLGIASDAILYVSGDKPLTLYKNGILRALYDFDSGEIITISYETSSGVYHREKGFWWNFGLEAEDYFNDYEVIYVKPEFVERFDLDEANGVRVHEDDITPYALTYEELNPND